MAIGDIAEDEVIVGVGFVAEAGEVVVEQAKVAGEVAGVEVACLHPGEEKATRVKLGQQGQLGVVAEADFVVGVGGVGVAVSAKGSVGFLGIGAVAQASLESHHDLAVEFGGGGKLVIAEEVNAAFEVVDLTVEGGEFGFKLCHEAAQGFEVVTGDKIGVCGEEGFEYVGAGVESGGEFVAVEGA